MDLFKPNVLVLLCRHSYSPPKVSHIDDSYGRFTKINEQVPLLSPSVVSGKVLGGFTITHTPQPTVRLSVTWWGWVYSSSCTASKLHLGFLLTLAKGSFQIP